MHMNRRQLLKSGMATAVLSGLSMPLVSRTSKAQQKQLRLLRWKNFIPEFETWFNDVFVREWGAENDVDVIVDNVGLGEINKLAAAEAAAGSGHDLVLFLSPRAALEDHVIDHREVFQACEDRYGKVSDAVRNSCFNSRTGKYHGFVESYLPSMVTYRNDLWQAVGKTPNSWEDVRKAGRAIKLLHDTPVGLSLGAEHNCEHTMRAIMYSYGAHVQNEEGRVVLDSKNTQEALKFAKSLYEEAMTSEVLDWGPPSNNQAILAGNASFTVDTMSIIRAAENTGLPVNTELKLAIIPEATQRRIAPMFGMNVYVIWKFAENKETAKKFLFDYIGRFQQAFLSSGFQNIPVFPKSVPDYEQLVVANSGILNRYDPLLDISPTMTNVGYPGNSNAAIDEVMGERFVSKMFAEVASGRMDASEAATQASKAIEPIFEKWRDAGKV